MPGIYGVANCKNVKNSLERMATTMCLYEHFIQDELVYDSVVGASRIHTGQVGEKKMPAREANCLIWVEGEAYNVGEVAAQMNLNALSLSKLLLLAEKEGRLDQCLNRLDGYYCASIYDLDKQKIKLISDRYGMRLLYWYHKNGIFAWGSEVKSIIAVEDVDKELDPSSFRTFINVGHLLDNNTWFLGIKLQEPASILEYDINSNKVEQRYYWTWGEIQPSNMSFNEAVDELGERFIEAVARRFDSRDRIGIALSGGLDSRAIFAAVRYLYPAYDGYTYTFGIPYCDDITIAESVVSKTNWQHKEYYFTADSWFEHRIEKVWNTDGMQDMMHMHGSEFVNSISENIDINLNGYLGDAVFGGSYLSKALKYMNSRPDFNLASHAYQDFGAEPSAEFFDLAHFDNYLYMNRGRRFINMGSANFLPWISQRKPFFDNKVVELVFSLPDEYRVNNKLYAAMLQKFFPDFFSDIPWQQTGKPAAGTNTSNIIGRALRKCARIAREKFGIASSRDYTDYPNWIRDAEIAGRLRDLLAPSTAKYRMVVNDNLAERWLEPHLKNRLINNSNEILRAATVEIYLRKVFDEKI